jgi:hypothetical protein
LAAKWIGMALLKKGVQLNGPIELEHPGGDGSGHVVYPIHIHIVASRVCGYVYPLGISACISCDSSFACLDYIVSRLVLSACAMQRWYTPNCHFAGCCVALQSVGGYGAVLTWRLGLVSLAHSHNSLCAW